MTHSSVEPTSSSRCRDSVPAAPSIAGKIDQRIRWATWIVLAGCAAGLSLCPKVWIGPRNFPTVPVWPGLPDISPTAAFSLYGALFVLLALAFCLPRRTAPLVIFLLLGIGWSLWDQNRWQPWFYQYLSMLICLTWAGRRGADIERQSALNACRLIVAGTYFWSGLQKANASFLGVVFPWLCEPLFPDQLPPAVAWSAYLIPPLETAMGLALLVPRLRRAAIVAVCVMHGLILLSIGPLGHSWNTVVWPWNFAMPLATIALFANSTDESFYSIAWGRWSWLHRAAAVLFLLLPALSFWSWWDSYLSASLYSGNTLRATLVLNHDAFERLPDGMQLDCEDLEHGWHELDLFTWSVHELNVPVYPSLRVFRSIHREACRRYSAERGDLTLVTRERPAWRSTERRLTQYRYP